MSKGRKWLLPAMLALICAGIVGTLGACTQKPNTGGNGGGGDNGGGGNTQNPIVHVHTYGDWVTTTAATCTTKGEKTKTCTASGCNNDDKRTYREEIVIDANAHAYVWQSSTPTTDSTVGSENYACSYDSTHTKTVSVTAGLEYNLINNKTAYEVKKGKANTDGEVVIPKLYNGKPVTSIGYQAFFCCSGTSFTIPNSVTSIGSIAFYNCSKLKNIYYKGTQSQWDAISKSYAKIPSDAVITYDYQG